MHPELILAAKPQVWVHLATVVPAFVLGTWLMWFSRRGSPRHRLLGKVYMVLMLVTATVSMLITEVRPGRLSWIHLFVPLTFWGVGKAWYSVRKGDIAGHRRAMMGLYIGGLLIAGGFTFFPGRLLYRVFFG